VQTSHLQFNQFGVETRAPAGEHGAEVQRAQAGRTVPAHVGRAGGLDPGARTHGPAQRDPGLPAGMQIGR